MKKILYLFFILSVETVYGQYAFRSADGNSGVVVGTNNASRFAGINYDLSSSMLGLSFRQTAQNLSDKNERVKTSSNRFPDLIGHNVYVGVSLTSSSATLLKNKAWQGGVEAAYDFSYTWDNTPIIEPEKIPSSSISTKNTLTFFSTNDSARKQFATIEECERTFGSPCTSIPTSISYYNLDSYEKRPKLNQTTLFFRVSGAVGRQNLATSVSTVKKDSLTLTDQVFVTPRLAVGLNLRRQLECLKKVTFTLAPSASYYFLPKSTGRLTEYTIQQVAGVFNTGKVTQLTDSKSYFLGSTEYEGILNPRLDLVASINLGEKNPYLNIIGAYSPTSSTFSDIGWKQNYAVGLGLSLPLLPDQMLFALLYEGLATNTDSGSHALTLYASVPFSFK